MTTHPGLKTISKLRFLGRACRPTRVGDTRRGCTGSRLYLCTPPDIQVALSGVFRRRGYLVVESAKCDTLRSASGQYSNQKQLTQACEAEG